MRKSTSTPNLRAKKPTPLLQQEVRLDFRKLFKSLALAASHYGTHRYDELVKDAVEAIGSLSLAKDPAELGYLLIQRSLFAAILELLTNSAGAVTIPDAELPDDFITDIMALQERTLIELDSKFFDQPKNLRILRDVAKFLERWLLAKKVHLAAARTITSRLPSYFVYSLINEWRTQSKYYLPLAEAIATPFAKAGAQEWDWKAYNSLLTQRIYESIFDEPFGLFHVYIPLNAFYYDELEANVSNRSKPKQKCVVSLDAELKEWIRNANAEPLRILSGGPGCGKSSFAKIFAADIAETGLSRVLFIPLHLYDPTKDLVEGVGQFIKSEGILGSNPLSSDSGDDKVLIIFDGLDELASQGKAAAQTARDFVHDVEKTIELRNTSTNRLRVLLSGREVTIQENETLFRKKKQVLTVLPYYLSKNEREEFLDRSNLLDQDLRDKWWSNYGQLKGDSISGLPKELKTAELEEITAQPLLNYLVALSYFRGEVDFKKEVNLNSIYSDLVQAVYQRAYEKGRSHVTIRHMEYNDFLRVLEEVALAAWHGDGRSTTVREIQIHCESSGIGEMLSKFKEGAEHGVTRLLAAFFFRRFGSRNDGDPTFVFTHKSFGEYLVCQRLMRATQTIVKERQRRSESPDDGLDERQALERWILVTGPSVFTTYLLRFVRAEMRLRDSKLVDQWHGQLSSLFSYVLRFGMPMEKLPSRSFLNACFQARNSEEALFCMINSCAETTRRHSKFDCPSSHAFGAWFRRIQGQRTGSDNSVAAECLSYLDISGAILHMADFYGCNFSHSLLDRIESAFSCFEGAILNDSSMQNALCSLSTFRHAQFHNANLSNTNFGESIASGATFINAKLTKVSLVGTNLRGSSFLNADLEGANLTAATVDAVVDAPQRRRIAFVSSETGASFKGAKLNGATLDHLNCNGCDFTEAKMSGTSAVGTDFKHAVIKQDQLRQLITVKPEKTEPPVPIDP